MALSWKEGGIPQFRPPPRLPGAPIPPIPNPLDKLTKLLHKVKEAIRAALGVIKQPIEDIIKAKKEDIRKAKVKLDSILEKKRKLEEKIQKAIDLYEKYKNLDEILYQEAMRLINAEIEKQKAKLLKEFEEQKKEITDKVKLRAAAIKSKLLSN